MSDLLERLRACTGLAADFYGEEMLEAIAEIERLRAALRRHGQHDMICPVSGGAREDFCTCGLYRALEG